MAMGHTATRWKTLGIAFLSVFIGSLYKLGFLRVFTEPSWSMQTQVDSLEGITALVTGANSGLGLHTAAKLCSKGATVICGVRSKTKFNEALDELQKLGCDPKNLKFPSELNLAEPTSVQQFVKATLQSLSGRTLDLLINNAGIMGTNPAHNSQGIEMQMATNHFGHALLTSLLMSALLESPNPRIVFHASSMHEFTDTIRYQDGAPHYNNSALNPFDIYMDTKLANMLYTSALGYAAHDTKLKVLSCHPGWTWTNLQRRSVIGKFLDLFSRVLGMHPSHGSESVLRAALDPVLENMSYVGPRYKLFGSPIVVSPQPYVFDIRKVAQFVRFTDQYMYQQIPSVPSSLYNFPRMR